MDYIQEPPAYVQNVNPEQICRTQLDKLISPNLTEKQKAELQFVFPIGSLEGKLSEFPPKGAKLIPNLEAGAIGRHGGLYRFYKYANSEREWDIALILNGNGMAMALYHNKGNPIELLGMVIPLDVIFNFYDNPLEPLKPDFDIGSLRAYIRDAHHLCRIALRQAFDSAYSRAKNKEKQEKPKIPPIPTQPKQRAGISRLNLQVSFRQKVIR